MQDIMPHTQMRDEICTRDIYNFSPDRYYVLFIQTAYTYKWSNPCIVMAVSGCEAMQKKHTAPHIMCNTLTSGSGGDTTGIAMASMLAVHNKLVK